MIVSVWMMVPWVVAAVFSLIAAELWRRAAMKWRTFSTECLEHTQKLVNDHYLIRKDSVPQGCGLGLVRLNYAPSTQVTGFTENQISERMH